MWTVVNWKFCALPEATYIQKKKFKLAVVLQVIRLRKLLLKPLKQHVENWEREGIHEVDAKGRN